MLIGFDQHWTDAVRRLDAFFGEDFLLEPYALPTRSDGRPDVNGRAVPDTARSRQRFRATFREIGAMKHAKGRTMAENVTRPIATDGAHLRLTLPVGEFDRPCVGDRIVRLKTGERFRATQVLNRGRDSLQVALNPVAP